ncbi:hypothetical protein CRI93_03025 [Longimonas halophila]|uniref:Inner membrane protein YgaP-like transmembrane domain-containing protein n=1 Tax=Longimonas halophila TaxID=1469170 RepID=A0A2H3NPF4_9BACT|nr:DUF2892 domain-containing protein [Longimonas halophila]PEN08745.1 hypothetical protein CRI93_03025 [Longimonas halophila]
MDTNVGTIDRMLRIGSALVVAGLYAGGVISGTWALGLGVVSGVLLLTGAVSFCPLYRLIGVSTCPVDSTA